MKSIQAYQGIVLDFDEIKHRFSVNGKSTLSVTSVTSIIDKSAPLMYWAVGLAKDFLLNQLTVGTIIASEHILEASQQHRVFKEKAASIGDLVHEFAENVSLGLKPEIPENENARNGALAFLRWLDESKLKLKNPEQMVYSKKYDYAGIVDSEATLGKKNYVVDFKTSKGIYSEYRYQVAAYLHALEEMTKRKYEGYYIVRFDKETGKFETLFVDYREAHADFQAFLGALTIRRREIQLKGNAR